MSYWRTYEWLVYNYYCCNNQLYQQDWTVDYDKHIQGQSGALRQIDILIKSKSQGVSKLIDCKCYKNVVDMKLIEEIIGMMEDVKVNAGVIVSPMGFTKNAIIRANNFGRLELKTMNFHDLFPYAFYHKNNLIIGCNGCISANNIFKNNNVYVDMNNYDIVFTDNHDRFLKIDIGLCEDKMAIVFHCIECKENICISIENIKEDEIKRCKCGIGYSIYRDENNNILGYRYLDYSNNELLSINNIYYLYNNGLLSNIQ